MFYINQEKVFFQFIVVSEGLFKNNCLAYKIILYN